MIRQLAETDDPSGFSCGSNALDHYLKTHALRNAAAGVSVTYIHASESGAIDGFVTLAGTSVRSAETFQDDNLPSYALPALLIARLAVDERTRGRGIGRALLTFALEEALVLHDRIGCVAVVVDAKHDAVSYYQRFGFEPATTATDGRRISRLFLPTRSVVDALG